MIDFFTAQKDLKEKTIRVLHNLSFVEDPTRAFRAIRFEQRFGFTIGKLTVNLIHNAVRMDFAELMVDRFQDVSVRDPIAQRLAQARKAKDSEAVALCQTVERKIRALRKP